MPREPKNRSALRDIRNATGLSQEAFAVCIGCTKDVLQNLENGRGKPLTQEQAARIYSLTGCELRRTGGAPAVMARDRKGRKYSTKSFEEWRQRCAETANEDAKRCRKLLGNLFRALNVAVAKSDNRNQASRFLVDVMRQAVETFNLGPAFCQSFRKTMERLSEDDEVARLRSFEQSAALVKGSHTKRVMFGPMLEAQRMKVRLRGQPPFPIRYGDNGVIVQPKHGASGIFNGVSLLLFPQPT